MSIKNIFNSQISTIIKERVLFYYLQGFCTIKKNIITNYFLNI